MPATQNHIRQLPNGLTVLAEPMEWLESVAFALLLPAGCNRDPADRLGLGNLTCEMIQRGCGSRNSRQFIEDLDNLGVERSSSVTNAHSSYGGAMPAERIYDCLDIYADLLRRPHLPEDQLEDARQLCLQEIRSLDDDLAHKAMLELRRRQYADPFGRASHGTLPAVEAISQADIQRFFESTYRPNGAILTVAGKIDWPRLSEQIERLFGDWEPLPRSQLVETPPVRSHHHIPHESEQTHITVAFPWLHHSNPNYYQARAGIGVLSDGMSSRLFSEVREKRGLVYTVYAACDSLVDRGAVMCYAGTTTDKAQETLDVLLAEVYRIAAGVRPDELERLKVKLKSSLIMQQESSASRAGSIAASWYYLGRIQTPAEIRQIIDDLTPDTVNAFLAANPPRDPVVVTLGEKPLEVPCGVS